MKTTFKIMKENENFFSEAYCFYFNKSLGNGKFSHQFLKKTLAHQKITMDQLVLSLFFQGYLQRRLLRGQL